MADILELKATAREAAGKGAARALRNTGRVPAIVYGDKAPPMAVSLEYRDVWQSMQTGLFLSTIYMLEVDGSQTRVIPRELQLDPVLDYPIHVDFLRLAKDATIRVEVPVQFVNEDESPGLKRGGALNIVRHTIELSCPVDLIPEGIQADLTGLEIGDSLHISDIKLPDQVVPTITDRDFTVATIAGAVAEEEPETEEDLEDEFEGEVLEGEGEGEEGEAEPEKD